MVSGQILLFDIMLLFCKREERAMSHKCLLLCLYNCTASLCLLLFSFGIGHFVTYVEEKRSVLSTVVEGKLAFGHEGL